MKERGNKILRIKATAIFFTITFLTIALLASAASWSDEYPPLTTDTNWDRRPSVTQTRDGMLWVVWASDREEYQYELYYKNSSDNGASWSPFVRLTTNSSIDEMPSVTQTCDGMLWVVWASQRTGNSEIFYKTSSNNGLSWFDAVQLTNYTGLDANPSITQNVDGKIWVVWHRNVEGNFDIFYKTSSDYGLSWSNAKAVTTHLDADLSPSITWTWDGTLWVVWASYRTGDYDIFYKTYSADEALLLDDTPLTTDPAWDEAPSIIQAVNGTLWVFWSSDRSGGQYDIYYKTSSDWSLDWPPLSTDTKVEDTEPSVTNIKDRKMLVVWESYRGTPANWDLFYVTSDEITPVHDIGITDMEARGYMRERAWVPRGGIIYINVTVENQGTFQETFDVDVYADRNTGDVHIDIGTQTGVTLTPGINTTLEFTWDTESASYGTYYISANATIVPGEYDILDNVMLHGARIGGICVPLQLPHIDIAAILVPIALATLFVAALGAIAIAIFKLLMSIRPRWPWPFAKKSSVNSVCQNRAIRSPVNKVSILGACQTSLRHVHHNYGYRYYSRKHALIS